MKMKALTCLALAGILGAAALAGCSPEEQQGNGTGGTPPVGIVTQPEEHKTTMGIHKINVGTTQTDFVADRKTDYTVITPAQADKFIEEAAALMVRHVAPATGAALSTATDEGLTWNKESKWIVLGSRSLFEAAGLTMPEEDIGSSGYYIRTVGNSVFVMSEGTHGVQNGALEVLRHAVGYEMYADDTVAYSVQPGDTVKLPDFDITEAPDFTYFMTSNRMSADAVTGMRFTSEVYIPVEGTVWHNSFCYLDPNDYPDHPEWFSLDDKTQLCYTARGNAEYFEAMLDEFMKKMTPAVEARPDLDNITITIQDNTDACRCPACTAEFEKYGTDSAAVVKFCNTVSDRLGAYFKEKAEKEGGEVRNVNILFFAYRKMFTPPVREVNGKFEPIDESVVCRDNVGVYIAPIDAAYNASFYDEINRTTADVIEGWGVCSKMLHMWLYETNYSYYLYPLNSYDSMLETYRFCKNNNAILMFPEGQYNQGNVTAFGKLKEYFNSKALWNVNVDYATILDDFFANYFREAAEPMRRYFDELQAQLKYIEQNYPEVGGGIYDNIAQARFWPKRMLEQWLGYMDEAYAAIEPYKATDPLLYDVLREHILLETIFPRFALVTLHTGSYSQQTLKAMRDEFRSDCTALDITMYSELTPLSAIFSSWN